MRVFDASKAALIMSIVFLISGIILLAIPDQFCAEAEKRLSEQGASESKIAEIEQELQSSSSALKNILLLIGGVVAASVILSLRMKDKLCVSSFVLAMVSVLSLLLPRLCVGFMDLALSTRRGFPK